MTERAADRDERAALTGDLSSAELTARGREVLDWIAEYLDHPERYPVLAQVRPGEIRASLPASPPAHGESLEQVLRDFEHTILPGITHWNHPAFFGYFATSSSVPGIVAEMLIAALDVKAMLWKASPAATRARTGRDRLAAADARSERGLVRDHDGHSVDVVDACARRGARVAPRSWGFVSAEWPGGAICHDSACTRRYTRIRRSTKPRSRWGSASRT